MSALPLNMNSFEVHAARVPRTAVRLYDLFALLDERSKYGMYNADDARVHCNIADRIDWQ